MAPALEQCRVPERFRSALCIPEQRAFFGFDLLYNRVHAWCGPGVEKDEIHNWIQALDAIRQKTDDGDWTIYCGHGSERERELISNMKEYLQTFLKVTSAAESREQAIRKMKQSFSGFAEDDFLLVQSVNFHVSESPANLTTS